MCKSCARRFYHFFLFVLATYLSRRHVDSFLAICVRSKTFPASGMLVAPRRYPAGIICFQGEINFRCPITQPLIRTSWIRPLRRRDRILLAFHALENLGNCNCVVLDRRNRCTSGQRKPGTGPYVVAPSTKRGRTMTKSFIACKKFTSEALADS